MPTLLRGRPARLLATLTRVFSNSASTVARAVKRLGGIGTSLGFWVALSVAGAVFLGVHLSVEYWEWLQKDTGSTSNAATVRNIGLVVGGVVAILIALWRSLVAEQQAKAAKRQSEIGERAYLNERYRQAASMLGDGELPVRLAGIFALERVAEDHPDEFRLEAGKLLCEFVRSPPDLNRPQPKVWDGRLQLERPATRKDVQAAMSAIAEMRRLHAIANPQEPDWLDLHDAQLCGVEFNMPLGGVNLKHANLRFANLEGRDLTRADLQWADCRHACLEQADLSGADMSDADFSSVQAWECKFRDAIMPGKMVDAELEEADLTDADFPNTDLTGAKLRSANLTGANFRGRIYWIDLWGGRHQAPENAVKIAQEQLDEAVADPDRPPTLNIRPVEDTEPATRLTWRGKAPPNGHSDDGK